MAQQEKPSTAVLSTKPAAAKQVSYIDLDSDDGYEKYRGNCGGAFTSVVTKAGGYRKWFDTTFARYKDNVYDSDKKITFGVTFGGLMRDRMKFPKLYTYDYDIILRIVRGEKRFIGGCLSSQEYVYNLYIKTSVENQNDIVSKFLKQFSIISIKHDASIYKDKRRSLSLGVGSASNPMSLIDRTSKDANKTDKDKDKDKDKDNSDKNKDDSKADEKKKVNADDNKEEAEESKYEHRVCNAHQDATDSKIKSSGETDIRKRIENIENTKYSVSVCQGIPDFGKFTEKEESDIIVSFVKDDLFRFQATYLKKSTFKDDGKAKKVVYDALYKWPKSAKEIFGKDNIPKQNTKGLLSVFTTVSSTKVDIKQSD